MNKNQEQKDNKKIILLIIITIILIPFSILVYINNKPKEKIENKNNNPFYEEKIIINENHSGDNLSNKEDSNTIKENLPSDGEQIEDTIIQKVEITNSYCDKNLEPINSIYNKYIYFDTIKDSCAMITSENSKYISEYTTKAYNKAISLKSKWENTYIKSKNDETGTFAYGKYTIKNKNGNILGFAITLTYNTSIYVLDKDDNWVLIKK